ncbi:MAG TPA: PIG-L family deacetylase [Stellaceae bacterium]|nr:PIG-L family deacetylase [Stellaceae bacterium]
MTGRRILLLAPHPDDEAVGCAALISHAQAAGAAILVFHLTTGVPAPEQLWRWQRGGYAARLARRRREAEQAAAMLAIELAGFLPWPSRRLRRHLDETSAAIARIVAARRIDTLWAPAWEGAHQDHDAAHVIAAGFRHRVSVWEYAAYTFAGGTVRSQSFAAEAAGEEVLRLDAAAAARKRAVLALYASERSNLRHIGLEQESLRLLPERDYARLPHPRPLFWERFQWVPFRHPRVDFDPPEAVYASLADWAGRHRHASPPIPAAGIAEVR